MLLTCCLERRFLYSIKAFTFLKNKKIDEMFSREGKYMGELPLENDACDSDVAAPNNYTWTL